MRPRWVNLSEIDRATFRAAIAFLDGRLKERATIDWALRLKPNNIVKRLALLDLIDSRVGRTIDEPWRSGWRLIEESWNNPAVEEHASSGAYHAQARLRGGDRSGALVAAIVDLVAPRLKVEPFSELHLRYQKPPKRPKTVNDLFSVSLTSGKIIKLGTLKLDDIRDRSFLVSLALALNAAVDRGLDIARRIGWDGESHLGPLGVLHRVYYLPPAERGDEPDEFHRGIAPSVKLLHAVISRLVDIDISVVSGFVRRWTLTDSPIHLRLWAALSRDARITPANEVATKLTSLDDRCFWNLYDYPEIAELRARRFGELDQNEQAALTARIRKRPPRNQWRRKADSDQVEGERLRWAVLELKRIEVAGATLSRRDKAWLDARTGESRELVHIDDGFPKGPTVRFVPPNPDDRYDLLSGKERLSALETALSSNSRGWDDDPARGAADWMINKPGNIVHILSDFESIPDGGTAFASVWEQFGWAHSPAKGQGEDIAQRDLPAESARVLSLLAKLPDATLRQAIKGISHWLSAWKKQVVVMPEGLSVWLMLWPIAVEDANTKQPIEKETYFNTIAQPSNDHEPMDMDTSNTCVGKLVEVFLVACPTVRPGDKPFREGNIQREMRDAIETALGTAGSIVKYRLIEEMPYFLAADEDWSLRNLVQPLLTFSGEARTLWRAVVRQRFSPEVMKILGNEMADRALDRHLGRETRRSLVFRIVVECLYAFQEQRDPAVPHPRIQQMIRSLDDEVRASAAEAIQRFVRDISAVGEGKRAPSSPEDIFHRIAAPFLQQVWPQERSLRTPAVSQVLASLPAVAREAFAEAVNAIERFLVPFDCWSITDYGFYVGEEGDPKLSSIDDAEKANAFLRLLDLTIGTAEGSVIPYDLAAALEQIRKVAPNLTKSKIFQRLATAARRG